jgi:hypothetical protein
MALHPLDRPVGSDLSQQVLERRRLQGELASAALDSQNRRLYGLPSQCVERHAFIADRESVRDSFQGEALRWPVLHRRERQ